MSKLERIAAFIAVVEANSFAAAAKKQGLSAAAMSRQIARLEADLNALLLNRTTRRISLTEIGSLYYQEAKNALRGLQEAELAIAGSQNVCTGLLRVTSNRYFAINYLLPHLAEFMAHHPELQINIELAERFADLSEENIDLMFGISMQGNDGLVQRRITTTQYILCASPEYLKKYGTPQTPADLIQHHYITHSMRKPDNIVTFKDGREICVKPTLWLNDSFAMCQCAIQGMGIVRLHDYIVEKALQDGRLIEILQEFREPQQAVYLYYQQKKYLQPKIRRFIDFYSEVARK